MSMNSIRNAYGVPAKRGGRIQFTPPFYRAQTGTITGTYEGHLLVRFDDQPDRLAAIHPSWKVTYL
jgi:hypothetical protein